jgi:hypothetical protein
MDRLPAGARKRLVAARRRAEGELKRALDRVPVSERVEPYLPAWREYAGEVFDAVADELLSASGGTERGWVIDAKALIAEEILPDASLARVALTDNMIKGIAIVWDMTTDLYYEERADGTRTLAREEILAAFARHGDWERLSPLCVRYKLRHDKEAKAVVCAALDQEMDMRAAYWLRRVTRPANGNDPRATAVALVDTIATASRVTPAAATEPLVASVLEFPNRAKWLKNRLAEREWNKHDLQRYGGPERRTTQKMLDGLPVQEDVLRKVIAGLKSKLTHKSRTLPAVEESSIPND